MNLGEYLLYRELKIETLCVVVQNGISKCVSLSISAPCRTYTVLNEGWRRIVGYGPTNVRGSYHCDLPSGATNRRDKGILPGWHRYLRTHIRGLQTIIFAKVSPIEAFYEIINLVLVPGHLD